MLNMFKLFTKREEPQAKPSKTDGYNGAIFQQMEEMFAQPERSSVEEEWGLVEDHKGDSSKMVGYNLAIYEQMKEIFSEKAKPKPR